MAMIYLFQVNCRLQICTSFVTPLSLWPTPDQHVPEPSVGQFAGALVQLQLEVQQMMGANAVSVVATLEDRHSTRIEIVLYVRAA